MTDTTLSKRIASIDILRGLVIVLMLIDHVRERFYLHHQVADPMLVDSTDPGLFFTRTLAHFCAPIFVFLTGLSAWLYANPANKPSRSARGFLFKRGLVLILLEVTLINFSWFAAYTTLYLQVMWAIGLSMIALAALISLPRMWQAILGLAIVFGHNLLTPITFAPNEFGYTLWTILHDRGFLISEGVLRVKVSYPLLPWIGVILLGYVCGPLFSAKVPAAIRLKTLLNGGLACLALLLVLRGFNIYGETLPWQNYDSAMLTLMSFFNFTKYPPSLDFLLMTLGTGALLLRYFETTNAGFAAKLETFGSVPMFFYVVHLYLLLIIYGVAVMLFGTNIQYKEYNYLGADSLIWVWGISAALTVALYFPCKAYAKLKRKSSNPILSYF